MSPEETYDQIDDFLDGKMKAEQRRAFEQKIAEDEVFARKVEDQRIHHEVMDRLVEQDLRSEMESWDNIPPPDKSNKQKNWWWLTLLPLLLIGAWWYYQPVDPGAFPVLSEPASPALPITDDPSPMENPAPSGEQTPKTEEAPRNNATEEEATDPGQQPKFVAFAQSNFQLYEKLNSGGLKSVNPTSGDSILMLIDELKTVDTAQIINRTKLLTGQEGYMLSARQLLGSLYFLNGQFMDAIPIYQYLSEVPLSTIKQESEWNLIQLYLITAPENKQIDTLLNKILSTEKHRFSTEAEQLLQLRTETK